MTINLSRRSFLGVLAAIPAASSIIGCTAQLAPSEDVDVVAANATSYPTFNLKRDCGAVGDGRTNDTSAFQKAAALLTKAGGGTLVIPAGTYIVGRQKRKTDPKAAGPYYANEEIFSVSGLKSLTISGYGATVRIASGLHYGGFDSTTGKPTDATVGHGNNVAAVGRVFECTECVDVAISGLEIDGNNTALVLGGQAGNQDRQASATGISLNRCLKATVLDVHTHHHALDGITVAQHGTQPTKPQPHTLKNVVSAYNGRQAISWIGGWGLSCIDCKFNHTGRAVNRGGGVESGLPLASLPKAGLDIEPNAGTQEVSKQGSFVRCEFIDNAGPGVLASVGNGGWTTFADCTIWGTSSYSLYLRQPGLKFTGCDIYGTAKNVGDGSTPSDNTPNPSLATVFDGCNFEDKEWTDGKVTRFGALYDVGTNSTGATWRNCTFTNHKVQSVYATSDTKELFESCTFFHGDAAMGNGGAQATFVASKITSCHFRETPAVSQGTKSYRIEVQNVTVGTPASGAPATKVDGPRVKWNSAGGLTGIIKPGTYA